MTDRNDAPDTPDAPEPSTPSGESSVPYESVASPVVEQKPPKKHGFARRHWKGLLLTTIVAVPVAAYSLWITATLAYTYSSGQRAGYNQKISHKGWICKTWEGELAVSSVPGVAPEIWQYSVRSDSVAHAIEE